MTTNATRRRRAHRQLSNPVRLPPAGARTLTRVLAGVRHRDRQTLCALELDWPGSRALLARLAVTRALRLSQSAPAAGAHEDAAACRGGRAVWPASARYDVLGVKIHAIDPPGLLQEVESWIVSRARRYVCHTNVHSVMGTLADPKLQQVWNQGFAVADGMPLVWLGRLQGRPVRRVYGPDLMLALCDRAARGGWPVFLLGGAEGVADQLGSTLQSRFPGLQVAGTIGPPYREATAEEDRAIVDQINSSGAELVFIGLGCPKQERWMADHRRRLTAPVLLGVGAAFDFLTGRVSQAPRWMMHLGLEWFYRLVQEPRRLWRRYLILNPLFVIHVLMQAMGLRRYSGDASCPPESA